MPDMKYQKLLTFNKIMKFACEKWQFDGFLFDTGLDHDFYEFRISVCPRKKYGVPRR